MKSLLPMILPAAIVPLVTLLPFSLIFPSWYRQHMITSTIVTALIFDCVILGLHFYSSRRHPKK